MRPKYGNRKVHMDGYSFDSNGEAMRWLALRQEQRNGLIEKLERQTRWKLYGKGGTMIGTLTVDFQYTQNGQIVVEEWKGMETQMYLLRERLFKDNYPGVEFRKSGSWKRIREKANARVRAKRATRKLLEAV